MDNILYYATLDKDNRVVNIAEESTGKIRCSPNFIPIASMDTTLIGKYYYNGQFVTEARRNLELMKTVDGSGSGLDADLLDGNDSSKVVKIDSTGKYATAPTPESTTDSSTKVATTNWVSNCETIPHLAMSNEFTKNQPTTACKKLFFSNSQAVDGYVELCSFKYSRFYSVTFVIKSALSNKTAEWNIIYATDIYSTYTESDVGGYYNLWITKDSNDVLHLYYATKVNDVYKTPRGGAWCVQALTSDDVNIIPLMTDGNRVTEMVGTVVWTNVTG